VNSGREKVVSIIHIFRGILNDDDCTIGAMGERMRRASVATERPEEVTSDI
jgi:hypothetical protein